MADLKFSCPQCGQHIGYTEAWAGHQIECPACHNGIMVPRLQRPAAAPPVSVPVTESAKAVGAKLASGVTQVARSTAHAPAPVKKFIPQRHGSDNSLLKVGAAVVAIGILAGVGYFYGLPLISGALQQESATSSPATAKSSQSGGAMGGPMGEVSGAMDVSEALDSGSSSPRRTRPVVGTNNAARSRLTRPPQ